MVYRVATSKVIFMNVMAILIGIALLCAAIAQMTAWQHGGFPQGASIIVLIPFAFFMMGWGLWALFRLRGKVLRLETSPTGLMFVSLRGVSSANWSSIDPFMIDPKMKTVSATVSGHDVSPNVANWGAFTLSARLFGMDEAVLAQQLNEARRAALAARGIAIAHTSM
jgi:hypothetical protein